MRDKLKLVETVITHLPDGHSIDAKTAIKVWFYNIRANGGLRLTELGYFTFQKVAEIECYRMEINDQTFNRMTSLKLDRKLQTPYYIEVKKKIATAIFFFGSREAMLAQLYGNLNKFLDNY